MLSDVVLPQNYKPGREAFLEESIERLEKNDGVLACF